MTNYLDHAHEKLSPQYVDSIGRIISISIIMGKASLCRIIFNLMMAASSDLENV
jgi:hypothetical protein